MAAKKHTGMKAWIVSATVAGVVGGTVYFAGSAQNSNAASDGVAVIATQSPAADSSATTDVGGSTQATTTATKAPTATPTATSASRARTSRSS